MPGVYPTNIETVVVNFEDTYNETAKREIDAADHIILQQKVTYSDGSIRERTIEMPLDQFIKNYEYSRMTHSVYGDILEVAQDRYGKIDFSQTLRARLFR